jgi:Novel toxin 11/Domain of unknown function (DUF4157)
MSTYEDRTADRQKANRPATSHSSTEQGGVNDAVLRLQRLIGNAAVGQLLSDSGEGTGESPVKRVVGSGGGRPVDAAWRKHMESHLGEDLSSVRVHTGSDASASAESIGAKAYTVGEHVVLGGSADATNPGIQRILAHELTHVVQQRNGPVDGTPAPGGIRLSDPSDRFEREAERTADAVMSGSVPVKSTAGGGARQGGVVQRAKGSTKKLSASQLQDYTLLQQAAGRANTGYDGYTLNALLTEADTINALVDKLPADANAEKLITALGVLPPSKIKGPRKPLYTTWEKLKKPARVQLIREQFYFPSNDREQTPPGQKLLALQARGGDATAGKKIYDRDEATWDATRSSSGDPKTKEGKRVNAVVDILGRLFDLLENRLFFTTMNNDENNLQKWTLPAAVSLSHGGRVNIKIPKVQPGESPDKFFNWLFGDKKARKSAGMSGRSAATHYVKIGTDASGAETFEEKKGFAAAKKGAFDRKWKNFGMDLPVGGYKNADFRGDSILPDGRHGHLYIGYKPPTKNKVGALLIGCETDAPGKTNPFAGKTNPLGHKHTMKATPAEMGPAMTDKTMRVGAAAGGMKIDLTRGGAVTDQWSQFISGIGQDVHDAQEGASNLFLDSEEKETETTEGTLTSSGSGIH